MSISNESPLCLCYSVTMTTVSTLLALGMMPLNIFLYGRSLGSKTVVIPYTKIIVSMLSLIVPIGIGLIIEWKLPKIAKIMIKVMIFHLLYRSSFTSVIQA